MKGRESGMPEEACWASFFDPQAVLERLWLPQNSRCNVLEFGCGYGTFTLPAASRTRGKVTALDIEPDMVSLVEQRAKDAGLANVRAEVRDFVERGTGVPDGSQGHVMVFNLIEDPLALLREALRIPVRTGLFIGLMFGVCNLAIREATLSLHTDDALVRGAVTVTTVTVLQVASLGLWLVFREPGLIAGIRDNLALSSFVGSSPAPLARSAGLPPLR